MPAKVRCLVTYVYDPKGVAQGNIMSMRKHVRIQTGVRNRVKTMVGRELTRNRVSHGGIV